MRYLSAPNRLAAALLLAWLLPLAPRATAEDTEQYLEDDNGAGAVKETKDDPRQAEEADRLRVASSNHVRRFHEVLDELLAEFGYDIKMGQIKGLSNLSVRQVRVSSAIPRTYEEYVEVLLAERMRENSQVRLIACVPCKTRTSSLVDGKLMITSPATNVAKLESAATALGIEYFMDAVLVYHTTHMVLAINVFNAQTKELVWARTYNSETIKSRYQKLAIDYSQVAKSRPGEDYVPEYRIMVGLGGAAMPNVGGTKEDSTMLNLQVRATEKFNNRKDEFGMMLSVLKTTASTMTAYPTEEGTGDAATPADTPAADETEITDAAPKPFETALGIYAVYSKVFLGSVESYNEVRHGAHAGIGGLLATGYIAPAFRLGLDSYLGRRFSVGISLNYVGASSILVGSETVKTKGGAGGDFIISLNF